MVADKDKDDMAAEDPDTMAAHRHRARMRALIEIGKELITAPGPAQLMDRVVSITSDILCADDCSLFLLDPGGETLRLAASRGMLRGEVGKATYERGEGLTGWVWEHNEPVRLVDIHGDPRWRGLYAEFPREELGAFLAVPVGRDQPVGVLRVVRRKRGNGDAAFTDEDEDVLCTFASGLAVALENAHLVEQLVKSERLAAWGEVSARAGHMIGNRVFALRGHLNELNHVVSQAQIDREAVRALVHRIETGIFRIEELLQEFREFVKATELATEPVDVNALVAQAIEETPTAHVAVAIETDLAEDLPPVVGDAGKLQRCFGELIENAVNHLPQGGWVKIRTRAVMGAQARDLCPRLPDAPMVEVEVTDSGPGIPEDLRSRIFQPFFSTRSQGMGLGLSIVKGIIDAHHGYICAAEPEQGGGRFVILLPQATRGG
jgi:signal transduction histidine kinase